MDTIIRQFAITFTNKWGFAVHVIREGEVMAEVVYKAMCEWDDNYGLTDVTVHASELYDMTELVTEEV